MNTGWSRCSSRRGRLHRAQNRWKRGEVREGGRSQTGPPGRPSPGRTCYRGLATAVLVVDTFLPSEESAPGGALVSGPARLPLYFPHLDKEHGTDTNARQRVDLLRREVDLLICLRWDGYIDHLLTLPEIEFYTPGPEDRKTHVTIDQRALVCPFTGPYDVLDSYIYPGCPPVNKRPCELASVGLCISAGFHLNGWPLCHWLGLAERLHERGAGIVLIGGPAEVGRLHMLQETLENSLGYRPPAIIGSSDFETTLGRLHRLVDLVVATDSGTAHLAGLVRPVVSVFGGSPWHKFAAAGPFQCHPVAPLSVQPLPAV